MRDVFFESDHAAKINYPYTDFEWRNIHFYSHFHEEIELAAVVSGSVSVTGDERALLAKTGDICVFMPGEIHSLTSDAENHLYIFKICCQSAKENIDLAAFRIKPNILTPEHPLNAALWTDIRRIKTASEQKSPGYSYLVNATANEMLYKIVSGGVLYKLDRQKRQKNISAISILTKSSEYIRAHYADAACGSRRLLWFFEILLCALFQGDHRADILRVSHRLSDADGSCGFAEF